MPATQLTAHPLHLGLDATAGIEPLFTGDLSWYEDYGRRHGNNGAEGRLVSMRSFPHPADTFT